MPNCDKKSLLIRNQNPKIFLVTNFPRFWLRIP
nr:MAG TPA: hypothetical protein [Caudoviricetes sp.]